MAATAITISDTATDLLGNGIPYAVVRALPTQSAANGGTPLTAATGNGSPGVKAVQTIAITGTPTGGSATATYGSAVVTIPYNATAAQVVSAYAAAGLTVTATGGQLPGTAVVVTFSTVGPVVTPTINYSGLTGGTSPTMTVTSTTAGVAVGAFSLTISATNDSGTANLTGEGQVLYDFLVRHPLTLEIYQEFTAPVPNSLTTTTLATLRANAVSMAE